MAVLLHGALERALDGSNDFMPLYVAAQLAGSHDLYKQGPYIDFQVERFSAMGESLRFTRLPFYSILLAPLGLFEYESAYVLWVLLRVAAIVSFVMLWPAVASKADTVLFICLSLPVFTALMTGQDVLLVLPLIALALRYEPTRPFVSGLALSLCAIKFHLFVLLPVLFLAQRRWDVGKGFAAGGAALLALSFAAGGWNWPAAYYGTLTDGRVHPGAFNMPNLHGIGLAMPLELAACALVAFGAWFAVRRTSFEIGMAIALVGGLLVSYHAYVMDCVILLPALLVVLVRAQAEWLKLASVLMLSPLLPMMLVSGRPYSYMMQVGLAVFFLALLAWVRQSQPEPSGAVRLIYG
jgi:hypothetical protein